VLGPEKLPRVVSEFGRWVGRARAMARQFREQLEEEVQLEQARKTQRAAPATSAPVPAAPPAAPTTSAPAEAAPPAAPPPPSSAEPSTVSHARPTDDTGADPTAGRAAPVASADERRA